MTTVQRKMIEDLRATLGEQADPAAVVERLYQSGVMDDIMARRYVVRREFVLRYSGTEKSARCIHEDLAGEYGLTRRGVTFIVSDGK